MTTAFSGADTSLQMEDAGASEGVELTGGALTYVPTSSNVSGIIPRTILYCCTPSPRPLVLGLL
jgi:hypothetical protein